MGARIALADDEVLGTFLSAASRLDALDTSKENLTEG